MYVQGPRPENVLFLIHEVFESIIEESFNGVSYDLYLPCPDCVTKEVGYLWGGGGGQIQTYSGLKQSAIDQSDFKN